MHISRYKITPVKGKDDLKVIFNTCARNSITLITVIASTCEPNIIVFACCMYVTIVRLVSTLVTIW